LKGSGTISSSGPDITNSGTISPGASPGRLAFNGKVVQTATGRVKIEIAGTQPISDYDVLSCSGQMVVGGTLQVAVLGGFVPPARSAYVAVKYGSHTGTFSAFEGLNLGGGLQFAPTYTDTAIILSTWPLAITSVNTYHGGNSGIVITFIHGVGFFDGLTAWLARGAQQIPAHIVGVSPLGTSFQAESESTGAAVAPGTSCETRADAFVTLPGGFTVEAPKPPQISVQIVGRQLVRVGSLAPYYIVFTNDGNTDAYDVPAWIKGISTSFPWNVSPPLDLPPPFPGAPPVDYSNIPTSTGTNEAILPIILMRVPAGQSVSVDLNVQVSSSSSFPLDVSVDPSYESPENSELPDCLFELLQTGLSCANAFVPGAGCARSIATFYLSAVITGAHLSPRHRARRRRGADRVHGPIFGGTISPRCPR
jgi:hypothetical protein